MQRRLSILFVLAALVAMLLTGCGTITETVGQNIIDTVAEALPTAAAAAQLPAATSDAVVQPASQTDPAAAPTTAPIPEVTAIATAPQATTRAVAVNRRPPPSRAPR